MAKPIVNFTGTPPLQVNFSNFTPVNIEVRPREIGQCDVKLSLNKNFKSCSFEGGLKEITQQVQVSVSNGAVICTFNVKMESINNDSFVTLFLASAENALGEKSYVKPIEVIIAQ